MIAAVTKNGVIGIDNQLPFDYPADMKHFRTTTSPQGLNGSVVIMGRKTFEGIGRPLPKRTNCVISSTPVAVEGVETFSSITQALDKYHDWVPASARPVETTAGGMSYPKMNDIWFIGGARIYEEGMKYADEIYLTLTPDKIEHPNVVRFPWINPQQFRVRSIKDLVPENSTLKLVIYDRY